MALPISIQLYTVRDRIQQNGYLPVLKEIADIGYGHVEMGGFYDKPAAQVAKELAELGLKVSGLWGPIFDAAKRAQFVDDANAAGTKDIISGYGKDVFESDDATKKTAETLNQALDYFIPKGFTVSLHNHWWEFLNTRYFMLLDLAPRAHLELDIYWAQVGGANPADVIKKYGKRVRFLHVKDGPANKREPQLDMVAVGKGDVKVAECIHAAEKADNVAALPIELDRCATDMMGAVRESYAFLTKNKLASGKK
jgi:sugar phosphate isomerase/epimerase